MARHRRQSSQVPRPNFDPFESRSLGDVGEFLVVPVTNQRYFQGTPIPVIGLEFAQGTHGLLLPRKALQVPQPIDLITTYITYQEVIGEPPRQTYVIDGLERVERDAFVIELARLLGAYEGLGASHKDIDLRLAKEWFRAKGLAEVDSRIRAGSALVAPQTALLLIEWALVISPKTVGPDTVAPNVGALILAVQDGLGIQGNADEAADAGRPHVFSGDTGSALFREVVSSADFYAQEDIASILAHHHARWIRLSGELAGSPESVDLADMFNQATGVAKDDFTAGWARPVGQLRNTRLVSDSRPSA